MIVREVLTEDSTKVLFAEHDDVIRALSPHSSDAPFAERILPGRVRADRLVRDSHAAHSTDEVVSIDSVVVPDQVFWLVPSPGNASIIWRAVQYAVGCVVTLKWTIFRRW